VAAVLPLDVPRLSPVTCGDIDTLIGLPGSVSAEDRDVSISLLHPETGHFVDCGRYFSRQM
jgi:hypothetical protein